MASVLAIVAKAVFEKKVGNTVAVGDVVNTDRYASTPTAFDQLADGDAIFLVTVRAPNEEPRGASRLGGRVRIEDVHLRGARRPGGDGEHRCRGCERAERLEGEPRAVRTDREATFDRAAGARSKHAGCRDRTRLIA